MQAILFKYTKRRCLQTGFTFIEMVLVIVILSIIGILGMRHTGYAKDANRYKETLNKIIVIKRAIVGDERLNNLGVQADMGYFETNYDFPPDDGSGHPDGTANRIPTDSLAAYLPPLPTTANYNPYTVDAWGNSLEYSTNVNVIAKYGYTDGFVDDSNIAYRYVEIKCLGKDGVATTATTPNIFNTDFHILIREDLYDENLMIMNTMDKNGVILRGPDGTATDHQICNVDIRNIDTGIVKYQVGGAVNKRIAYGQGFFSMPDVVKDIAGNLDANVSEILSGKYIFRVSPANGVGGTTNGSQDHRGSLIGGAVNSIDIPITIYPKDPDNPNFIEIRFPGAVDIDKL